MPEGLRAFLARISLRGPFAEEQERLRCELGDHALDLIERLRQEGLDEAAAVQRALERLGDPSEISRSFTRAAWRSRLGRGGYHAALSVLAFLGCCLFVPRPGTLIVFASLGSVAIAASLAFCLPRKQGAIAAGYLVTVPVVGVAAMLAAWQAGGVTRAGSPIAVFVTGSLYGLLYFGLFPDERSSRQWSWATAVPVLALLDVDSFLATSLRIPIFSPLSGASFALPALWRPAVACCVVLLFARSSASKRDLEVEARRFSVLSCGAALACVLSVRVLVSLTGHALFHLFLCTLPYLAAILCALRRRGSNRASRAAEP